MIVIKYKPLHASFLVICLMKSERYKCMLKSADFIQVGLSQWNKMHFVQFVSDEYDVNNFYIAFTDLTGKYPPTARTCICSFGPAPPPPPTRQPTTCSYSKHFS